MNNYKYIVLRLVYFFPAYAQINLNWSNTKIPGVKVRPARGPDNNDNQLYLG
jgi:hypothetical protein